MAFNPRRAEVEHMSRPEREKGAGEAHRHLRGQSEVNSADTLQQPQAAVNHSAVFWLAHSENNCRGSLQASNRLTKPTHALLHVC